MRLMSKANDRSADLNHLDSGQRWGLIEQFSIYIHRLATWPEIGAVLFRESPPYVAMRAVKLHPLASPRQIINEQAQCVQASRRGPGWARTMRVRSSAR